MMLRPLRLVIVLVIGLAAVIACYPEGYCPGCDLVLDPYCGALERESDRISADYQRQIGSEPEVPLADQLSALHDPFEAHVELVGLLQYLGDPDRGTNSAELTGVHSAAASEVEAHSIQYALGDAPEDRPESLVDSLLEQASSPGVFRDVDIFTQSWCGVQIFGLLEPGKLQPIPVGSIPDCDSLTDGVEVPDDFFGCFDGEALIGGFFWECPGGPPFITLYRPVTPPEPLGDMYGWARLGQEFHEGEVPLGTPCWGATVCPTEGMKVSGEFPGCDPSDPQVDRPFVESEVFDCSDGRRVVTLGQPGDPWYGWSYAGEEFTQSEPFPTDNCPRG